MTDASYIASTAMIHPAVRLGKVCVVEDYVLLGKPVKPGTPPLETEIGPYSTIRSHSVVYAGAKIGSHFQSGHHALIREGTVIGDHCSVGSGSVVEFSVTMEDNVRLHSGVFVPEYTVLEAGCWIGPRVVFTNAPYPAAPKTKEHLHGVRVCKNARIGAAAVLLPGVVIGEGALVGAGSVVTKEVPAGAVVVGNPARVIGKVEDLVYSGSDEAVYPREDIDP